MSFENIVGNKEVKHLLIHSVSTSNILHSYMFVGIDGIGKCLFAKEFAREILASTVELDNNPDFMLIDAEDGKSIKIEQVRYMQEKLLKNLLQQTKKFI